MTKKVVLVGMGRDEMPWLKAFLHYRKMKDTSRGFSLNNKVREDVTGVNCKVEEVYFN